MEINWPVPEFIGQKYTSPSGDIWEWNGYAWEFLGSEGSSGGGCDILPISEDDIFSILSGASPSPGLKSGCKYRIYDAGVNNGAPGSSTDDGESGFVTIATSTTSISPRGTWRFVKENYSKMALFIATYHDPYGTYNNQSVNDIQIDGDSITSTFHTYTPGPGNIQDLLNDISNDINTLSGGTWEAISNSWTSGEDQSNQRTTDIGVIYLKSKIAGDRNNLDASFTLSVGDKDPIVLAQSSISAWGSETELISLDGDYDYVSKNVVRAYDPVSDVEVSNDFYSGISNPMIYDFPWGVNRSAPRVGIAIASPGSPMIASSTFKNCISNFRQYFYNYLTIDESNFFNTSLIAEVDTAVHLTIENVNCNISNFKFDEVVNVLSTDLPGGKGAIIDLGVQIYSSEIMGSEIEFNAYYSVVGSDFIISKSSIMDTVMYFGKSDSVESPYTSKLISQSTPISIIDTYLKSNTINIYDTVFSKSTVDFYSLSMENSVVNINGDTGSSNWLSSSSILLGSSPGKFLTKTVIDSLYLEIIGIVSLGSGSLNFRLRESYISHSRVYINNIILPSAFLGGLVFYSDRARIIESEFNINDSDLSNADVVRITLANGATNASEIFNSQFVLQNWNVVNGSNSEFYMDLSRSNIRNSLFSLNSLTIDLASTTTPRIDLIDSVFDNFTLNLDNTTLQSTGSSDFIMTFFGEFRKVTNFIFSEVSLRNFVLKSGLDDGASACYFYDSSFEVSTGASLEEVEVLLEKSIFNNSSILFPAETITSKKWQFAENDLKSSEISLINGTNSSDWKMKNCNIFNTDLDFSDSTVNSLSPLPVEWKNLTVNNREVTISIYDPSFSKAAAVTTNTSFYVPSLFVPQQINLGKTLLWGGSPSPTTSPVVLGLDTAGTFSNNIQEDLFDALSTNITNASSLISSSSTESEFIEITTTSEIVIPSILDITIKGRLI